MNLSIYLSIFIYLFSCLSPYQEEHSFFLPLSECHYIFTSIFCIYSSIFLSFYISVFTYAFFFFICSFSHIYPFTSLCSYLLISFFLHIYSYIYLNYIIDLCLHPSVTPFLQPSSLFLPLFLSCPTHLVTSWPGIDSQHGYSMWVYFFCDGRSVEMSFFPLVIPFSLSHFLSLRWVFIYVSWLQLSDVMAGGKTAFPLAGVAVKPVKGAAAFWFNIKRNGDFNWKTQHGGCPVLLGQKWGEASVVKTLSC